MLRWSNTLIWSFVLKLLTHRSFAQHHSILPHRSYLLVVVWYNTQATWFEAEKRALICSPLSVSTKGKCPPIFAAEIAKLAIVYVPQKVWYGLSTDYLYIHKYLPDRSPWNFFVYRWLIFPGNADIIIEIATNWSEAKTYDSVTWPADSFTVRGLHE